MKKILTRFGEVEYDETKLLHFPSGLIGLPNLRDFIVMPNQKEGPLFWIQSVDDPEMAFVLTDPTNFFVDYKVLPEKEDREMLQIEEGDDCLALVIVTVPEDLNITLNLAAPILYSPEQNRAIQVILDNANKKDIWDTRTPLPEFEEE